MSTPFSHSNMGAGGPVRRTGRRLFSFMGNMSMKITPEEVAHVAALARLKFDDEQLEMFTGQLNDILTHMDHMAQLDTSGVPVSSHALALTGAMRPDEARPSLAREEALANAPQQNDEAFVVPKVI